MKHSIVVGAESFDATNSGIARVARLTLRVLSGELATVSKVQALALNGSAPLPPGESCNGSRVRFVLRNAVAAARATHCFYDFLGISRAHVKLPGLRRPFAVWIHGVEVWQPVRPVYLKSALNADRLIANSRYTVERARVASRVLDVTRVCWLGTETDDSWKCIERPHPPTVMILSRIDHVTIKGHDVLLASWPLVRAAVPDARLVVVGGGPGLRSVKELAREYNVEDSVVFTGFLPDHSIDTWWAECDVFSMLSDRDGFGLVYIEAMRRGKAVVAGQATAGAEVVGQSGLCVPRSANSLADALIYLLRNDQERCRFGNSAMERWRTTFSFSAFRDRFKSIAQEFLAAAPEL